MGVLDYIKTAGDLAVNMRNVELQGTVLEIKREVLQLQEELLNERRQNAELRRERDSKQAVRFDKQTCSYYMHRDDGTKDGPFCQRCQDADQKLIRTHDFKYQTGRRRECPECDMKIWLEKWDPPPQPRRATSSWVNARRG
jgi:hypothetical protein